MTPPHNRDASIVSHVLSDLFHPSFLMLPLERVVLVSAKSFERECFINSMRITGLTELLHEDIY